jgi:hypothetical protein
MGVAELTFDAAIVEAAPLRSGGTPLQRYACGPALPFAIRSPKAPRKAAGHVHGHVEGGGDDLVGRGSGRDDRSPFADTRTPVRVIVAIMTRPRVREAPGRLDGTPDATGRQEWLRRIPVTGAPYDRARHQPDDRRQIETVAIHMRSHGDAPFVSSCRPDAFRVGPSPAWA